MLRTTIAQGNLRSLSNATSPFRATLPFRLRSERAATIRPFTRFSLPSHIYRRSPKPRSIWQRLRFFHHSRPRKNGPASSNPGTTSAVAGDAEPQTLGAKMRKLTREYGWSAAGVYFTLSALDLPFCYLLVKILGPDKIGEWEHKVVTKIAPLIPESVKQKYQELKQKFHEWWSPEESTEQATIQPVEDVGWHVEEAQQNYKINASLATQVALALAIHKSFIFARVPLAAAITPSVVKFLRGRGWDIGKRTTKEAKALKRAQRAEVAKKA